MSEPEQGTRATAAPFGAPEIDDRGGVYAGGQHDPRDEAPQVASDYAGAGPTVEEMAATLADQKIRSTLGEYEKQLADFMAKAEAGFAAQQQAMDAQRAQLQGQIAAVRAQAGPPEAITLSASLAQRVKTIAAAHPDLGALHFAGVIDQAQRLDDAVKAAAEGTGPVAEAERLANGVITWFTRSHPRVTSRVLELGGAALEEAERIIEKLPELAPVAEAIAAAV